MMVMVEGVVMVFDFDVNMWEIVEFVVWDWLCGELGLEVLFVDWLVEDVCMLVCLFDFVCCIEV